MKTFKEQITDLENTRGTQAAEQSRLFQKAMTEGRTTDNEEADRIDEIEKSLDAIDADIARLRRMDARNLEQAKSVVGATPQQAAQSRDPGAPAVVRSREPDDKFPGQSFTRMVIARAAARLEGTTPATVANQRWGKSNPKLVEVIRAGEVPGGGTGAGEWGNELVAIDGRYRGDFIEYLYSMTAFDKLGLREVPANVTIKGQDGAATAYWVGESKAIPATAVDFFPVHLSPLKVAALAVVSNDLMRYSDQSAEMMVRDALVNASAQRIDTTFFSNAAAVAGVSPAGILNGLTAVTASGTTADALRADIKSIYLPFIAAHNAAGVTLVMNSSLAKSIQLMVNALGQGEFSTLTMLGGTLLGDRVVTSDNVPPGTIVAIKPSDVYRIGDTGVDVRISDVATVEQSTAPTGATDTPAAMSQAITSMFQEDSSAIRVIRHINFAKRRASAVAFIGAAAYSS